MENIDRIRVTLIDNRIGDDAVSVENIGQEIEITFEHGRIFFAGEEVTKEKGGILLRRILRGDFIVKDFFLIKQNNDLG